MQEFHIVNIIHEPTLLFIMISAIIVIIILAYRLKKVEATVSNVVEEMTNMRDVMANNNGKLSDADRFDIIDRFLQKEDSNEIIKKVNEEVHNMGDRNRVAASLDPREKEE